MKGLVSLLLCGLLVVFAAGASAAEWTFLVYMDGDNNLEGSGIEDINEMEQVGSDSNVNIVVLFDRIGGYDTSNGNWTDTRRGRIVQDSNTSTVSSTLTSVGEKNMGDPATLTEFISWGVTNYPATHYGLVLWNHGDGWRSAQIQLEKKLEALKKRLSDAKSEEAKSSIKTEIDKVHQDLSKIEVIKGVCWDDTDGEDYLSTKEIRNALEGVGTPIDLIGFDACLMQMMEVAYEVSSVASVMVGSEQTEPADGWPYHLFLSNLKSNPTMSPAQLGSSIVDGYATYYGGSETQSAVDLTHINLLAGNLSSLASAVMTAGTEWGTYFNARASSNSYTETDYRDLYTFLDEMSTQTSNGSVVAAANQAKTTLSSAVIANHSSLYEGATGLSIYLTNLGVSPSASYASSVLQFAANTQWDEMLQAASSQSVPDDSFEPNNTNTSASLVTLGSHEDLVCQDDDWFKFDLPADSFVNIAVEHNAYEGDLDIVLYNSSMTEIASGETGSDIECVSVHTSGGGTYYLKIFEYYGDVNYSYNLHLLQTNCSTEYSIASVSYNWIDRAGATFLDMGDDDSTSVSIGFGFNFFDKTYSTIKISANGYLTFGYDGSVYSNQPLPLPGEPDGVIAPYWDDLYPPTGGVYYKVIGTPGNRQFVVIWENCEHYDSTGGITVQAVLSEANGAIQFNYQDVIFSSSDYNNGASATVGIENGEGSIGFLHSFMEAVLTNNTSIKYIPVSVTSIDQGWELYK